MPAKRPYAGRDDGAAHRRAPVGGGDDGAAHRRARQVVSYAEPTGNVFIVNNGHGDRTRVDLGDGGGGGQVVRGRRGGGGGEVDIEKVEREVNEMEVFFGGRMQEFRDVSAEQTTQRDMDRKREAIERCGTIDRECKARDVQRVEGRRKMYPNVPGETFKGSETQLISDARESIRELHEYCIGVENARIVSTKDADGSCYDALSDQIEDLFGVKSKEAVGNPRLVLRIEEVKKGVIERLKALRETESGELDDELKTALAKLDVEMLEVTTQLDAEGLFGSNLRKVMREGLRERKMAKKGLVGVAEVINGCLCDGGFHIVDPCCDCDDCDTRICAVCHALTLMHGAGNGVQLLATTGIEMCPCQQSKPAAARVKNPKAKEAGHAVLNGVLEIYQEKLKEQVADFGQEGVDKILSYINGMKEQFRRGGNQWIFDGDGDGGGDAVVFEHRDRDMSMREIGVVLGTKFKHEPNEELAYVLWNALYPEITEFLTQWKSADTAIEEQIQAEMNPAGIKDSEVLQYLRQFNGVDNEKVRLLKADQLTILHKKRIPLEQKHDLTMPALEFIATSKLAQKYKIEGWEDMTLRQVQKAIIEERCAWRTHGSGCTHRMSIWGEEAFKECVALRCPETCENYDKVERYCGLCGIQGFDLDGTIHNHCEYCMKQFKVYKRLGEGETKFTEQYQQAQRAAGGRMREIVASWVVLSDLGIFQAIFLEKLFDMFGTLPMSLRGGAFVSFLKNLGIHQQEYPITEEDVFKALDSWNEGKAVSGQIPSVLSRVFLSSKEESEDAWRRKEEVAKKVAEEKKKKEERHSQYLKEAPGKLEGVINATVENYWLYRMAPTRLLSMETSERNRVMAKAFRLNPDLRSEVIERIQSQENFARMFYAEYPGKSFEDHRNERLEKEGEPLDWVKAEIYKKGNAKLLIGISASVLAAVNRKRRRVLDSSSEESSDASDDDPVDPTQVYPLVVKPFVYELQAKLPRLESQGFGWDIRKKAKAQARAAAQAAAAVNGGAAAAAAAVNGGAAAAQAIAAGGNGGVAAVNGGAADDQDIMVINDDD